MGWLNLKEQRRVKRKFKIQALYLCDYCEEPIGLRDLPVIDPKGGYHPWPENFPLAARQLTAREPKRTYHNHPCNDELIGKRLKTLDKIKEFRRLPQKVRRAGRGIMRRLKENPVSGYWTKKKLFKKMRHHDHHSVVKALRFLRSERQIKKKEGGYVARI